MLRDEILALRQADGLIHAVHVVSWAHDNIGSELHRHFQWDDAKAAQAYRLEQARQLIQVYVVDVDQQRLTISLVSDRTNGGGYRDLDAVLNNAQMRREALLEALAELERWQRRNAHFTELRPIFAAVGRVRNKIDPPSPRPSPGSPLPDQPNAAAPP